MKQVILYMLPADISVTHKWAVSNWLLQYEVILPHLMDIALQRLSN